MESSWGRLSCQKLLMLCQASQRQSVDMQLPCTGHFILANLIILSSISSKRELQKEVFPWLGMGKHAWSPFTWWLTSNVFYSLMLFASVLVLAGIELIFFIVASMGMCFAFVLRTVLIAQGCFSYCWAVLTQSQGLCCSSPHPASEEAGGAQGVGRGHSRDSWPQLTKGIFHTIWHHAQHIKLEEEEGGRGTFGAMAFVIPSNHYVWWSPAFLEMAEQLPAEGK